VGVPARVYAQGQPHQIEHPFRPPSMQEMVLRAKAAKTAELDVEPVQGNVFAIFGAGGNVTVSVGLDGIAVVDTGKAEMSDKLLAVIKKLGEAVEPTRDSPPVPIRVIFNTNARPEYTGGNEKLEGASEFVQGGEHIMAYENVLARMSEPPAGQTKPPRPSEAWPTDTYRNETNKFGRFFNGEGVQLIHTPNAFTDGDSIIWFRHSDVMAVGGLVRMTGWPIIDADRGGSFQGVINGLNLILRTGISDFRTEGGTLIVPGEGRLCDLADVANYRDLLTIIKDRMADGIKRGLTLEQVKAARPTQGWDNRWGSTTGAWTTDMFVDAAYKSLSKDAKPAAPARPAAAPKAAAPAPKK
jgi:hypothetical protein